MRVCVWKKKSAGEKAVTESLQNRTHEAPSSQEKRPVIIRGKGHARANEAFYAMTEVERLVVTHGDREMSLTSAESSTKNMGFGKMPFKQYIGAHTRTHTRARRLCRRIHT